MRTIAAALFLTGFIVGGLLWHDADVAATARKFDGGVLPRRISKSRFQLGCLPVYLASAAVNGARERIRRVVGTVYDSTPA